MPDDDGAFLTALTTEHFGLAGARSATVSESAGRSALYLASVSSTLIALGLVAQVADETLRRSWWPECRLGPPLRLPVVMLAGPDESPPPDNVSYYSHGGERVAATILSVSGRRLFLEYEPDGVVRSNVLGYLYGDQRLP